MTRPKAITISKPFDAKHVGGVSIPGSTIPIEGVHGSFASTTLEPDEIPTHMNIGSTRDSPKRSNTIAHSLKLKTSISRLRGRSISDYSSTHRKRDRESTPEPPPPPPPPHPSKLSPERTTPIQSRPDKKLPTRPKRADSGTAIDFDNVPAEERPLGFREIMAIHSFEERMALYKRSRDYWACADHGLSEWVAHAGVRRPLVAQV